jgi:uncharacterized protein (DUF1800 family)
MTPEERMASQRRLARESFELRAWWLREMIETPSPLSERMTLFWHNHFATSQQKVRSVQLMYRQNTLLRRESLGQLRHAPARDRQGPGDAGVPRQRRQSPAGTQRKLRTRVMELFTLGEGNYTEHDVKEAARAFTGWSLDRETGEFTYRRFWHDYGEKTVLGRSGRLDGDDVIDTLLLRGRRPRASWPRSCGASSCRRRPIPRRVSRWADVFRQARYEVKPLLRAALTSDAFWAESKPWRAGEIAGGPWSSGRCARSASVPWTCARQYSRAPRLARTRSRRPT